VPNNSSCGFTVTFTPTATGPFNGSLSVQAGATSLPLALTGTGVIPFYLSGTTASFGNQGVNIASAPKTVYLFNYSGAPVSPVIPALTGVFTTAPGSCGNPLPNNSSCGFTVTFTPPATGSFTGSLNVQVGATTLPLALTGTGVIPFYLSGTTASFGNQGVNIPSAPKTVYLFNYSGAPVSPVIPALTGVFTTAPGSCANPVPNNSSCGFTVTFTPPATGPFTGSLSVQVGATTLPLALTGTGMVPLYLSGTTAAFGNEGVSVTSAPKTVYLFNYSGAPVSPVIPALTGVFTTAPGSCANPVPNNSSCGFTVTFTPPATGPFTGSLNVQVGTTTLPLALTGTGMVPLYLSGTTAAFGNQAVNTSSAPKTVYLFNYSGAQVSPVIPALTGVFTTAPGSCANPVPNNSSCGFTVTFTPTATGPANGSLNVQVGATTLPLALTGTGQ
jgi:hypothetical protein